jgi:hypothetical protein
MPKATRVKWYAVLAIGVAFAVGGTWMIIRGQEHGWSVLLFFGLCAAVSIGKLWPGLFMPRTVPPLLLLQRFPGPVELCLSRLKLSYLLAGTAVFGGEAVYLLQNDRFSWFATLALCFGAVGCAVAIPFMALLMVRGSLLRLDREGLLIRHGWRRQFVPWVKTSIFEVAVLPTPSHQKMVVYNDVASCGMIGTINIGITGRNAALPDSYGLSHEQLAWLLNQWRARALGIDTNDPGPRAEAADLAR